METQLLIINYATIIGIVISMEEVLKGFGTIIAVVLLTLAPHIYKWFEKFFKKHSDYFTKNLVLRRQINDELREIRLKFSADRVCIFEFSNTDKSISNFPFEYLSCTFEQTNGQVVEIRDDWQKKHINNHVEFLELFASQEILYRILQSEDRNIPENVTMTFERQHIKTCLIYKLSKEVRNGFVALHFMTSEYEEDWDIEKGQHEQHRFLKMKAYNIVSLMKSLQ